MRTLSSELTTAQRDASRTPYIKVVFRSRDRATTRTYLTTDSTNRLLGVQQAESRYNGHLAVPDSAFPISAIIQLQDSDKGVNTLDFKGYRCDISWGFNTSAGDEASQTQPSFVIDQRSFSSEGSLIVELYCISMWGLLRTAWKKQTTSSQIIYDQDVSVRHIMMELLGGRTVDAALLYDDSAGTKHTDYTDASVNPTDGANQGSTGDVAFLPGPPAVGDAFYVGDTDQFDTISWDMSTLGVGTWTVTWEYWTTGSVWASLSGVDDNTSGFKPATLTQQTTTFDRPTDWDTTHRAEQSFAAPFPTAAYYYVRGRVSSFTSYTTQPVGNKIVVAQDFSMALDSNNSDQGDDDKPQYASDLNQDVAEVVADILANSLLAVVAKPDGFHLVYTDDVVSSVDYTFSSATHAVISNTLRDTVVIPNKITYMNVRPSDPATPISGSDEDTTSSGQIGVIPDFRVSELITSSGVGDTHAQRAIKRLKRDSGQGTVEVPMECGLEVWDVVRVEDIRSDLNFSGIISQLVRTYEPGVYQLTIGVGETQFSATPIRGILAQLLDMEGVGEIAPRPKRPFTREGEMEIIDGPKVPMNIVDGGPGRGEHVPPPAGDPERLSEEIRRVAREDALVGSQLVRRGRVVPPSQGVSSGGPADIPIPPRPVRRFTAIQDVVIAAPSRRGLAVNPVNVGVDSSFFDAHRGVASMSPNSPVTTVGGRRDPWAEYSLPRAGGVSNKAFLHVDGGQTSYMRGNLGVGGPPARDLHVRGIGDATTAFILLTSNATGHTNDDGFHINVDSARDVHLMQQENDDLYLGTNDIDRVKIDQDGNVSMTQYLEFGEVGDPAAPTAAGRLYCKDNGGKTELVVKFPTGAVQQLAIEP